MPATAAPKAREDRSEALAVPQAAHPTTGGSVLPRPAAVRPRTDHRFAGASPRKRANTPQAAAPQPFVPQRSARRPALPEPSLPQPNLPPSVLPQPGLTDREQQVLRCWLLSASKEEASVKLHLAHGTIKSHLHRIRTKYDAVDRTAGTKAALVVRALQDGIVGLDEF